MIFRVQYHKEPSCEYERKGEYGKSDFGRRRHQTTLNADGHDRAKEPKYQGSPRVLLIKTKAQGSGRQ